MDEATEAVVFARYGKLVTDAVIDDDGEVVELLTYEKLVVCCVADDTAAIVMLLAYGTVIEDCSIDETATVVELSSYRALEVYWVAAVVVLPIYEASVTDTLAELIMFCVSVAD